MSCPVDPLVPRFNSRQVTPPPNADPSPPMTTQKTFQAFISLFILTTTFACDPTAQSTKNPPATTGLSPTNEDKTSASATVVSPTPPASVSATKPANQTAFITDSELGALVKELSEKPGDFPSDNFVSNETSLLDVASELMNENLKKRAYVGVGPEQNFSYMALMQPQVAYIIDIRRGNLLELLLLRTCIEQSPTRQDFLSNLLSRKLPPNQATGPQEISTILDKFKEVSPDQQALNNIIEKTVQLQDRLNIPTEPNDKKEIAKIAQAFFDKGLNLAYSMKGSSRKYPTFQELMVMTDSATKAGSFLSSEQSYRGIRTMFLENRVVPVVGDFGGTKALQAIAQDMVKRNLKLGAFYTSNVEQYLFEDNKYKNFVANVKAMPHDESSLLVQVWFDQGKAHPKQRPGHRTTSIVHKVVPFLERAEKKPFRSFWEVMTQ